jgi:hypothetical protein
MNRHSPSQPLLLSVEQFCTTYGFSRASIYQLAKCRRIPVIRNGPKGFGLKLDPVKVLAALETPAKSKIGAEK